MMQTSCLLIHAALYFKTLTMQILECRGRSEALLAGPSEAKERLICHIKALCNDELFCECTCAAGQKTTPEGARGQRHEASWGRHCPVGG